jgi:trigger factor
MKVTQEKLPSSQIGLEIEIAPEKTKQTYEQVIKNFASNANIPGFRKGKVPRQILVQRLGASRIKAAALEEIIKDSIEQAVKEQDIQAIGQPQLRSSFEELVTNYEPGKPLTFSAAVDVEPEVQLGQYTGLHFKAEEVQPDREQVDKVLENERQQMGTLIPVEGRSAQFGDVAVVDFKGVLAASSGEEQTAEPTPIPGAQGTDFQVELQENRFIPGFVAGIVGMNPGETKEISAQFPDPYTNNDLAGKNALFTVTLKELKEKELPELNDDFAREVSDFDTIAELRASLEERFQKEAFEKTKQNKIEALLVELMKHSSVDLPETMIAQEVDSMLTQTAMQLSRQGVDVRQLFTSETISKLRSNTRPEAIERLKRSLALREIKQRESIAVSPEETNARVQELMQNYSGQEIDMERLQENIENELLTEKILDWLLEHSNIELVPEGSLSSTPASAEGEATPPAPESITEPVGEAVSTSEGEALSPAPESTTEPG